MVRRPCSLWKPRGEGNIFMKKFIFGALFLLQTMGLVPLSFAHDPKTPLQLAAASDLKFALDEAIQVFEKKHPQHSVRASYGSSGNFAAQLMQSAPFDLFLAADARYTEVLIEKGFAKKEDSFRYATGRIVLWVQKSSSVDLKKGINVLLDPKIKKIAIANPKHAPYGEAAVAALKSAGIYEKIEKKLVFGENVAQAAQFIQSESAQAGLIALSLAKAEPMEKSGRYWKVPESSYPPLKQSGLILNRKNGDSVFAQEFKSFLLSAEGQEILEKYGLGSDSPQL